jgi:hypothetical protein
VSAEVSPLEQRCLLSSGGLVGGHHALKSKHVNSGNPVIINFAGYQWDANYNWSQDSGPFINNQFWSPSNAVVKSDGLHLKLAKANINGKRQFASAEVDLVATSSGQPYNPGYGTYLVSAKTGNGVSFNQFTMNRDAIFGAFTYENLHGVGNVSRSTSTIKGLPASVVATLKKGMEVSGNNYKGAPLFYNSATLKTKILSITGDTINLTMPPLPGASGLHTVYFTDLSLTNRHRELDMLEASRFGTQYNKTNAQFTLQPYAKLPANVHRITLTDQGQITLVMQWTAPEQPVTFSEYNGTYTLGDLPMTPNISWTTSASTQDQFIPNSYHQTFHLNLWQAFWEGVPQPTSVVVTNFQYQPET